MTANDALTTIIALAPFAVTAGCLLGYRYPWLILGRNQHGRPRRFD